MIKLLKIGVLSVLLSIVSVSATDAAFIFHKATNQVTAETKTIAPATTSVQEKGLSKKDARKEFKSYFKRKGQGGFGGGKSKIVAALLAFFLGQFGVHSFYMGQTTKGLVQLGAFLLGLGLYIGGIAGYVSSEGLSYPTLALVGLLLVVIVDIWALVDFVRILTGGLEPEEGFDS